MSGICLKAYKELSFRHQLAKMSSGVEKKSSTQTCTIRAQTETLTERHEQKQIDLTEFLQGLSSLVSKKRKNKN
jgi:hypothetical protein